MTFGESPEIQTQALMLHAIDYSESDQIAHFFTKDYGKLEGFAKASKKSQKRFGGDLNQFVLFDMFFADRKDSELVVIQRIEGIEYFEKIQERIKSFAISSLVLEMYSVFFAPHSPNPRAFLLLAEILRRINSVGDDNYLFMKALHETAAAVGFAPSLETCASCGKELSITHFAAFSPSTGGILCKQCYSQKSDIVSVSAELLNKWISASKENSLIPNEQKVSEGEFGNFLSVFDRFITFHAEKRLNTPAFALSLYKK